MYNITLDVVLSGGSRECSGLIYQANSNVVAISCLIMMEVASSNKDFSGIVGNMLGHNLTVMNCSFSIILSTTTGNNEMFQTAIFCGKLAGKYFSLTNNVVLASMVRSSNRMGVIVS